MSRSPWVRRVHGLRRTLRAWASTGWSRREPAARLLARLWALPLALESPRFTPGLFDRARHLQPLQRMLYYDQKVWLPDDLLVKADKMTMAASLERRVPFLDHKVVEWAWRVPPSLKIRRGEGKGLLRQEFVDLVPAPILARPKEDFTVGGGARFRENVGREARWMLVDDRALHGVVDSGPVARMVQRHTTHATTSPSRCSRSCSHGGAASF